MTDSQQMVRTTLGTPGQTRIKRIHFVGIGGVGMSGIAEVLLQEGYQVSGSDQKHSTTTERLQSLGATIYMGHESGNVEHVDVLVTSTAVKEDNPEVLAARSLRVPIVRRAEMLAELMRFRYGVAISGTHGKTTTTSLVSSIVAQGGLDPSFVIGGQLNSAGSNAYLGKSQYIITEADESDASFLHLLPMMAVVTNIDLDHMDTYQGDVEKLYDTFVRFLQQLPFYGLAIVCIDDPGVQAILPRISRPLLTYGFSDDADTRAFDLEYQVMQTSFTVSRNQHKDLRITLNLPGDHNVLNALAAIAVATELGVDDQSIVQSLKEFQGVGRRFQVLGEFALDKGSATIIDDYAHHPRELEATISAARNAWPDRRVVLVFQPHRYSRTRDLFDDFVNVLQEPDLLILLKVFPSGEKPIAHADSRSLSRSVRQRGKLDPIFVEKHEALAEVFSGALKNGDVVLMCGAGSIGSLAKALSET